MLRSLLAHFYRLARPAPKPKPPMLNAKGEPVMARLYILTDGRGRRVASR